MEKAENKKHPIYINLAGLCEATTCLLEMAGCKIVR